MSNTLKSLNDKLAAITSEAEKEKQQLAASYNEVFNELPELQDAIAKLEASDEYRWNDCGEICQVYYWPGLKDFEDCSEFLDSYLQEYHCIRVAWASEALELDQGDSFVIQDDSRYGRDNGVWLNGKRIISEDQYKTEDEEIDEEKRNTLIEAYMEKSGYFPGVFRVDQHGNIFPVNTLKKAAS